MSDDEKRRLPLRLFARYRERAAEASALLADAHEAGWTSGHRDGRSEAFGELVNMCFQKLQALKDRWRELDDEARKGLAETYGGTGEAAVAAAHFGAAGTSLADVMEWLSEERKKL